MRVLSVLAFCSVVGHVVVKYPGEEKYDIGSLEGDVQNWAMLIQNYILQVFVTTIILSFLVCSLPIYRFGL